MREKAQPRRTSHISGEGQWKEEMNNERMLELADELEHPSRLKLNFNMADFITLLNPKFDCVTTACIGGHACLMFGDDGTIIGEAAAKQLLDLTNDQAHRLFYNENEYISLERFEKITREEAAAAVRRMVREEGQ